MPDGIHNSEEGVLDTECADLLYSRRPREEFQ